MTKDDIIKLPPLSEEKKQEFCIALKAYADSCPKINWEDDLPQQITNHVLTEYHQEQERRIEYALRFLIPQPIKGEITKSKVRYRGLYLREDRSRAFCFPPEYNEEKHSLTYRMFFPYLCGRKSRSGKRPEFKIDLNFDLDTFVAYNFWCEKNKVMAFGKPTEPVRRVNGIAGQTKKGD